MTKVRIKIGTKLLISYMLLIIICFGVSMGVFNVLSRQYMVSQARDDLRQQGTALAKVVSRNIPAITGQQNSSQDSSAAESDIKNPGELQESDIYNVRKQQMQLAGRLIDTRLVLLSSREQVLYTNLDSDSLGKYLEERAGKKASADYVAEEFNIKDEKGETQLVLILLASMQDLQSINRVGFRAQVVSMVVAIALALVLGWFFERNLSRPLYRLMNGIQSFSINRPLPDISVNTGDEVEALAHCFTDMASKLKSYDERQKAMLQNTSHELKTPLMSIQGYAEAIRDGVVEGNEVNESLDIIIKESQRLKNTVSDLLYLTRVENADEEFHMEEMAIDEVISQAVRTLKPLAAERNVEIVVEARPNLCLWLDEEKISRMFINIIGNDLRYARSRVAVECGTADGSVVVTVQDDGPGFEKGEEARVFDRFYKGKSGGSGLGLAISKAIVTGHGGRIEAFNASGGGAVFQILLPIRNRPPGRHK